MTRKSSGGACTDGVIDQAWRAVQELRGAQRQA
jgi:hypothetical protein